MMFKKKRPVLDKGNQAVGFLRVTKAGRVYSERLGAHHW